MEPTDGAEDSPTRPSASTEVYMRKLTKNSNASYGQLNPHWLPFQPLQSVASRGYNVTLRMLWFKKTVSKEEMGSALWQVCCREAEDFCKSVGPKLQGEGFLNDWTTDTRFMNEAVIVHYHIIWTALNKERAVLDVFNNFLNCSPIIQQSGMESVYSRFPLYNEAILKDEGMRAKGLMVGHLAWTALQCLVNRPGNKDFSARILTEVGLRLWSFFPAVRKLRNEFRIR